MSNLRASVILDLTGNIEARARRMTGAMTRMSTVSGRAMQRLSGHAAQLGRGMDAMGNRYTAMIAGAGVTYKATRAIMDSAGLDKQLIRVKQTASAAEQAARALRKELHAMAKETGKDLDDLRGGFNNLIQSGLDWRAATATIPAVNRAMAVSGSGAGALTSGLTVAAEIYGHDLTDPKTAERLLDQFLVAGRLGNAEIEDLASIFSRVGANAKTAGLSDAQTLGFIEQLSMFEKNPERLATLTDSTLRLFTNQNYLKKAAKVTGVSFYDAEGERRAAFDVLDDIAAKYQTLKSRQRKDRFIFAAFGEADMDTRKGLATLLSGDNLAGVRNMTRDIQNASGTIAKDLPDALSNSVDQAARLRATLREAADGFAQPVNDTIEQAIKYLLDDKKLSGETILGGAAAAGVLGFGAIKGGGRLLSRVGGLGGGLVAGKALEEVSGVQPVYVVNMPGGFGGGFSGGGAAGGTKGKLGRQMAQRGSRLAKLGRYGRGLGRVAGVAGVGLTAYDLYDTWSDDEVSREAKIVQTGEAVGGLGGAAVGAAIGSAIVPVIGTILGGLAGYFIGEYGGEKAGEALADATQERPEGRVVVEITGGQARVQQLQASHMQLDVDTGLNMWDVD